MKPTRAPSAVYLMLVPLIAGVVGCALVYPSRHSRGWIMELNDGALAGSIIALIAALAFLLIAAAAHQATPQATLQVRAAQVVMSIVLGLATIIAALDVIVRIHDGEPIDAAVVPAAWLYGAGGILQAVAATIGLIRIRAARRSSSPPAPE